MRLTARNTAWLLPFVLTGCFHFHRNNAAKNPPVAPPLSADTTIKTVPVELPPSATTIPPEPTETAKTPTRATPKPPTPRRKPQPARNTQQDVAANAQPPAVSAIGQLSSGNPADYRRETEESILSIEKGLNGLNRSLSAPEQKTAEHIREFLKQARLALSSGDVDGARNLAAKAKVLLAELTK